MDRTGVWAAEALYGLTKALSLVSQSNDNDGMFNTFVMSFESAGS